MHGHLQAGTAVGAAWGWGWKHSASPSPGCPASLLSCRLPLSQSHLKASISLFCHKPSPSGTVRLSRAPSVTASRNPSAPMNAPRLLIGVDTFRQGHTAPPGPWAAHGAPRSPPETTGCSYKLNSPVLPGGELCSAFPLARTPLKKLTRKTRRDALGNPAMTDTWELPARLRSHPAAGTPEERYGMSHTPLLPSGGSLPNGESGAPRGGGAAPEERPAAPGPEGLWRGCGGPVPGAGRRRRARARSPAEDEESARRYLVGSRRLRAPAAGKKETLQRAPCLPGGAGRGQLSRGFCAALAREPEREGCRGVRVMGVT